ncbi:MAG: hypothetical protein WBD57_14090 [Candidatus Cybelea sp.]
MASFFITRWSDSNDCSIESPHGHRTSTLMSKGGFLGTCEEGAFYPQASAAATMPPR